MSFSISLTPHNRIQEAFELMRAEIPSFAINPRTENFANEYLAYIEATYMGGAFGSEATGYHWNFYDRLEEGQLTNNPSEGANNRLATRMGGPHPGFYHFCSVLKKELENSKNNVEDFENGSSQVAKKKILQENRMTLKTKLEERKITFRKYLRAQGALNHCKPKGGRRVGGGRGAGGGGGARGGGAGEGGEGSQLRAALRSVTEEDTYSGKFSQESLENNTCLLAGACYLQVRVRVRGPGRGEEASVVAGGGQGQEE